MEEGSGVAGLIKGPEDLGEVCPGEVPAEIAGGRCAAGEGGEEGGG